MTYDYDCEDGVPAARPGCMGFHNRMILLRSRIQSPYGVQVEALEDAVFIRFQSPFSLDHWEMLANFAPKLHKLCCQNLGRHAKRPVCCADVTISK
jgi:hypothetical protein